MITPPSAELTTIRSQAARLVDEVKTIESKVRHLKRAAFSLSGGDPAMLLIDFVSEEFEVDIEEMRSASRPDNIALPRMVVMALAVEMLGMTMKASASLVRRVPWTAMHAVESVRRRCDTEPKVARKVASVRAAMMPLLQPKTPNT